MSGMAESGVESTEIVSSTTYSSVTVCSFLVKVPC